MKLIFVWLLAIVFLIDSVLRAIRSSFNLGVLMMYLITAALWMYALFHTKIDAFCAAGAGRVLKIIFFCCCAVFALLLIFVAVSGYSDTATKQEKTVIVLGAGLRGERVTDLLARRLDAAYDYHLENPNAVIVVTGGQGPGEDIPEARGHESLSCGEKACRRSKFWKKRPVRPPRKIFALRAKFWNSTVFRRTNPSRMSPMRSIVTAQQNTLPPQASQM